MLDIAGEFDDTRIDDFDIFDTITISEPLDITSIAIKQRNKTNKLNEKVNSSESVVKMDEGIKADKTHIIWAGAELKVDNIKNFSLVISSSESQLVNVSVKNDSRYFQLTDENGEVKYHQVERTFKRNVIEKFYVSFNPPDTNYYHSVLIITCGSRRLKVTLFGYSVSALVYLHGFSKSIDGTFYTKTVKKTPGLENIVVTVCNSGARTAFVKLDADAVQNLRIYPSTFLLTSKTLKDICIRPNDPENTSHIKFYVYYVDEEIRRATRTNLPELKPCSSFNRFIEMGIFKRISDEKAIDQSEFNFILQQRKELSKFDWRRVLCKQINDNFYDHHLNLSYNKSASPEGRWTDDSMSTVEIFSEISKVTLDRNSQIDLIMKTINIKSPNENYNEYMTGITIKNAENYFSPSQVNYSTYLGVLLRNHNNYNVNWRMSKMVLISKKNNELQSDTEIVSLQSSGKIFAHTSFVVPIEYMAKCCGVVTCTCTMKITKEDGSVILETPLSFVGQSLHEKAIFNYPVIPAFKINNKINKTIPLKTKSKFKIRVTNLTPHDMEIFTSSLGRPFAHKSKSLILPKGQSDLIITIETKKEGTFKDVLVMCDEFGNYTYTLLNIIGE